MTSGIRVRADIARSRIQIGGLILLLIASLGHAAIGGTLDLSRAVNFSIPAQSLASALLQYSRQAHVQVAAAGAPVDGVNSPGVSGRWPIGVALAQVLAGTGFTFSVSGEDSVAILRSDRVVSTHAAVEAQSVSDAPRAAGPRENDETEASKPAAATNERSTGLEEIVVTATKRETRLQDTPISLSALSANEIEKNRVLTMDDVAQRVPSLVYMPQSGSETYISIRGAATIDDSTGTDQAVTMFIDDVARVSVADLQPELFDMERVEVLNGPQGTLFGRNSVGGTVSLYTRQPNFKTEGTVEATYGEYNLVELKGMFNVPLIADCLAARVTATRGANDGYIRDITTSSYIGNEDRWTSTGKLLFTPTDDFKAVVGFDYQHKQGSNPTWLIGNFYPALDPGITFNPTQTAQRSPGRIDQTIWGFTGRLDWTLAPGTMTSITGYRHVYAFDESIVTADPLDTVPFYSTEHDTQLTEELRLASPSQQALSWVIGLYYLNSHRDRPLDVVVNVIPGSFLTVIPGVLPSPINYIIDQNTHTRSYAGFADGIYAITDALKLDLGGRYTWESKDGSSYINPAGFVSGPSISGQYSHSWSAFTPKATLSYKPISPLMVYATVSRGFESGGFNVQGSTDAALRIPFKPEYLTNYEIGAKFDGFERRLQVSVSGFLDRYKDLQVVEYNDATLSSLTTNAGTANVNGVESDIAVAPLEWLALGLKYDYLDTRFTKYVIDNGPGNPPTINTGNRVPFAPTNRITANADIHLDLPQGGGRLALGADYAYRDSMWLDVANDTPQDVRSKTAWRGLVNGHLQWTSKDSRWGVVVWGKNITNLHYVTFTGDKSTFLLSPDEANNAANHIFDAHPVVRTAGVTFRVRM
jgi:iron complex outermembrane recepter protein